MQVLPEALLPLAAYPQFIVWAPVWDESKQKYHKKPRNPATGYDHSPTDPAIWMDANTALATAANNPEYEVGFVFTESDPFWFLDIDKCVTPEGNWSDTAQHLMSLFPGAAIEISYSGRGLHIFGTGTVLPHRCRDVLGLDLEFYTQERFVALTGTSAVGNALTDHTAQLAAAIPYYFPERVGQSSDEWTDAPHPDWHGPKDDDKLIEKMLATKSAGSAFASDKATFEDLWTCDIEKLSAAYPDHFGEGREYDGSKTDQALCNHLAFWTGADCERMDRLYRQSQLYRDKWEREDYREGTILLATGGCANFYNSKPKEKPQLTDADTVKPAAEQVSTSATATFREGLQFLAPSSQVELFEGCVYVRDVHRVYTPDGAMLKPEQFKATYGGYLFALDAINDKTEKNAWTVFTESQAVHFPTAHRPCFRPELAQGSLVDEEGLVLVNTYVPIDVPSEAGDVSRFLNHMALILPDESDREILLSYMAAVVQHKGEKFPWAPLIQGIEGNGKSLIISVLSAAVGNRYTHKPNAQELGGGGSKFTAWLQNKLFIGIEEIYVSDRREVSDALKPLITDDRVEIQGKGADQVMGDNRANFVLCSNHKDAILKNRGDRRYAVFFTAQQSPEDLHQAGMVLSDGVTPTRYFPDLYDWLKKHGGFANVTHYLENFEIAAELNPAELCVRAPSTTSTEEAIEQSRGGVEQEIQEAIYQNRPGFAGGWVSSMALDNLLQALNAARKIPRNKRASLMDELGFVSHPGLIGGRVNNFVTIDNGKPRLYVRKGSIQSSLTGSAVISDAYIKAQGSATGALGDVAEAFK